ncbi:MAG: pyridoxal-dependent decarboxylase, partial [Thermocrispum sp.]
MDVEGKSELATTLRPWLEEIDLDDDLCRGPALQRTRVPLHPDRRATRVPDSPAGPLVAVAWPTASVAAREANRRRIADALSRSGPPSADDLLTAVVPDEYAIARMSTGDAWSFAPDYGTTVEDALRAGGLNRSERAQLVRTLAELRARLLDAGIVWQGFAPRNMFRVGDRLVLIDFEACAVIEQEPVAAAEYLAWHSVFFADCLTGEESRLVFATHSRTPDISPQTTLPADPFERALLGVAEVTWGDRAGLLARSARLEGRHARQSDARDKGVLFGHELGHFWGDFLPVHTEAAIFRILDPLESPADLVACLEVFEAAMEADIDSMLLADAARAPLSAAARTSAMTELLEDAGPETIASVRRSQDEWYARLVRDPARLVDDVLAHVHGENAARLSFNYLIGNEGARGVHADRLRAAVDVGLRFVHADERDDRFLVHAEPEELLKMAAEPLPVSGAAFDAVLDSVEERIARFSISQSHRGYLAFPDSGNAVAAVAGSMLTRLLNQNLIAVERSAPAATFATIQVIEWLRELVGYEAMPLTDFRGVKDVAGMWTTGGHMSNHLAMLTALGHRFPLVRQHGLRALDTEPVVIMAGPIAHYSHSDAAFHLGLGWDAVRQVPARQDYTTDPEAIEAMLADPPDDVTPFMVIG